MGKVCACLSVVLVLVVTAVRVGVRILLMGKDCACLSVVLVLCASFARSCTDTAYGQGLRVFLRGPGVQCDLRALVYGYGLWARIALFLRGPGAQRDLRALVH